MPDESATHLGVEVARRGALISKIEIAAAKSNLKSKLKERYQMAQDQGPYGRGGATNLRRCRGRLTRSRVCVRRRSSVGLIPSMRCSRLISPAR